MRITGFYAGLLALIGLFLSASVSGVRMKEKVSLGDGGNPALIVAVRRFGNFAEHVPFALLLLGIVESNGIDPRMLHALGGTLFLARVLHPFGIRTDFRPNLPRALGMFATFLVVLVAAGLALWQCFAVR
ncbi:MAG: MAPEG family protein [Polyangiales bacterium]